MANEEVKRFTAEGIKKLQEELNYLISVRRNEVAEQIKEAKSFGDLSENAEYDAARNEQSRLEGRIQELEYILSNAEVISDEELAILGKNFGYEYWERVDETHSGVRFCGSWATTQEQVDALREAVNALKK